MLLYTWYCYNMITSLHLQLQSDKIAALAAILSILFSYYTICTYCTHCTYFTTAPTVPFVTIIFTVLYWVYFTYILMRFLIITIMVRVIFIELNFAWGFQKIYNTWGVKWKIVPRNLTWMMSSILLRFLMVIMMVGVIFIALNFAWGFQKYTILGVLSKVERCIFGYCCTYCTCCTV